ncbi:hypothetical protein ACIBCB_18420 [Streptomyces uncialis]|uniref:hypothetical protein n=1 Tax=Streptomyces uncialis TaxID=1048205 RepID=UPI0037A6256E
MPTHIRLPWYIYATGALVLAVALGMSAPGEYQLARAAGWGPWAAAGMPVCLSVYAAVAVGFVEAGKKGDTGRRTAVMGAIGALTLTLAAQVVAHWLAAGYMHTSMALTAAVSAVPAIVVGHVSHMIIRAARRPWPKQPHQSEEGKGKGNQGKHEAPVQPTLDGEHEADELTQARKRRPGRPGPSLDELQAAAEAIAQAGVKVTGPALAEFMGRDRRQGSRYLAKLNAA